MSMDTALKQRLIGAAVLVALAVFFLPMLVKGPAPDSGVSDVSLDIPNAPQGGMETRDLPLAAPGEVPSGGAVGLDANPVDRPGSATPGAAAPDATTPATGTGSDAGGEPGEKPSEMAAPDPATTTGTVLPATAAGGDYAVHFGAYATAQAAQTVVVLAKNAQLPAYSEPATVGGKAAWRVRIGPYATRADAESARLKALDVRSDVPVRVVVLDAESANSVPSAPTVTPTPVPTPSEAPRPVAAKPAEPSRPEPPKPEPRPLAAKPAELPPVAPKPATPKPAPAPSNPVASKPAAPKPAAPKPAAPKPADTIASMPKPTAAPKPEPNPAPKPATPPKPVAAVPTPAAASPVAPTLPAPKPIAVTPKPAESGGFVAVAPKPKTKPVTTAKVGFAVQLGAFGDVAEANALRDRLRASGFAAFTETVTTDSGKLTRVRVGPVVDRAAADQLKAQVQAKSGVGGIVRPHP
jgi:cell division septation protein DedD